MLTLKARQMIIGRYGKKFPNECVDCGCVNPKVWSFFYLFSDYPKIVSRLTKKSPDPSLVGYYLSAIAKEHNIPGFDLPVRSRFFLSH